MINREILDTVFRGLKADFNGKLKIAGEDKSADEIATTVPSSTASERFDWFGQLPDARKWVGARKINQLTNFKYEVFHDYYEVTLAVKREDILDNTLGGYKLQALTGAEAMSYLKPKLICQALNSGKSNLCYDGQNFFSTDHPVGNDGDETAVPNLFDNGGAQATHPWYMLDVSRAVKPILFVEREKPQFQSFQSMQDWHAFMTREFIFGAHARYGSGYGLWQFAARNEGALCYNTAKTCYDAMSDYRGDELDEDGRRKKMGVNPSVIVCGQSNYLAARALVEHPYLQSKTDPLEIGSSNTPNPFFGLFKVVKLSWQP